METENRLAMVRVSSQAFVDILTHGTKYPLIMEGLPSDAVFHHAYYDHERRCFSLIVASPSFAPVDAYCHPPVLPVKVSIVGFVPDDDPPPDPPLPEITMHEYEAGTFYTM